MIRTSIPATEGWGRYAKGWSVDGVGGLDEGFGQKGSCELRCGEECFSLRRMYRNCKLQKEGEKPILIFCDTGTGGASCT